MSDGFIIAIDGPVAAGKGTIASLLAQRLNGFYLYTGAMYRALALYCLENSINPEDQKLVETCLPKIEIKLDFEKVILNGQDVTERLKKEDVAKVVPKVALIPSVRKEMVKRQQEIAEEFIEKNKIVIAEGRDTGTRVFPNAELKVFLTAETEIRAKRRLEQLKEKGDTTDLTTVLGNIKERDRLDIERETDPLVSHPENYGYFILDNSNLTQQQTIDTILLELKRRKLIN